MDVVLGPEVREYTINYIDDLLIVSKSFKEHLVQVLQRLQDAGMIVNLEKYVFLQEKVTFLGHVLSSQGISTDSGKVEATQQLPGSKNAKTSSSIPWSVRILPQILREVQPRDGPIDETPVEGRPVVLD
jgi:hypothetical protein